LNHKAKIKIMRNISYFKVLFPILLLVTLSACPNPEEENDALSGYIYFDFSSSLFRLNTKENTVEKLTNNATQPDVMSNGNIVALEGGATGKIIITDLYGTNRKTILSHLNDQNTPHLLTLNAPRISYDQKNIAYDGYNYRPVTYVVDAVTGALIYTIGTYNNSNEHFYSPSWAPDGSLFVQGGKATNNGIYKIDKTFSSITRIDPQLSNVEFPAVSPDGSTIAFLKDFELWTMGVDGSNPTKINTNLQGISPPTWSPDSKNIAIIAYTTIYVVNLNALTIESVAENAAQYSRMSWR